MEPERILFQNWITTRWKAMERWESVGPGIEELRISIARIDTDVYLSWVAEIGKRDGVWPHIEFGGAQIAGKGDRTFKARWVEYARTLT
jgi:hypothetical protein